MRAVIYVQCNHWLCASWVPTMSDYRSHALMEILRPTRWRALSMHTNRHEFNYLYGVGNVGSSRHSRSPETAGGIRRSLGKGPILPRSFSVFELVRIMTLSSGDPAVNSPRADQMQGMQGPLEPQQVQQTHEVDGIFLEKGASKTGGFSCACLRRAKLLHARRTATDTRPRLQQHCFKLAVLLRLCSREKTPCQHFTEAGQMAPAAAAVHDAAASGVPSSDSSVGDSLQCTCGCDVAEP